MNAEPLVLIITGLILLAIFLMMFKTPLERKKAKEWWSSQPGREEAACDQCGTKISRGKGYLREPRLRGQHLGKLYVDHSSTPDLVCTQCFKG